MIILNKNTIFFPRKIKRFQIWPVNISKLGFGICFSLCNTIRLLIDILSADLVIHSCGGSVIYDSHHDHQVINSHNMEESLLNRMLFMLI